MRASIVVDLMFGDSGKGITTDYLCTGKNNIVIRFSGGQQSGHNVKINNVSHVHSNYGSGTLRGVPSYFSEHTTIYPVTMWNEYLTLREKNVKPLLYIHPLAKVTTPADVAYNQIRERRKNHGSCGLGVGSTMTRNINTGYKLFAIDLKTPSVLYAKMKNINNYYLDLITDKQEKKIFTNSVSIAMVVFEKAMENLDFNIKNYDFLSDFDHLIFEGSQGIMLDMDHGIFPNVTYANTTSKNAIEICKKVGLLTTYNVEIYNVTRCYQTRHGNGWMSNNTPIDLINTDDEINKFNEWQKDFKVTEIDYDLLKQSLIIDDIYSHSYKKNLVVTCLDQRPNFKFHTWELDEFNFQSIYYSYSPDSKDFKLKKEKTYFF